MDNKGFRLPQYPKQPSSSFVKQEANREIDAQALKTYPAPDNRYNAYAAVMEDANFITDYRQSCVTRAPPGSQYAVKQWTIHNSDQVMNISRKRQAEQTGHVLGSADTELPAAQFQSCTTNSCSIVNSGTSYGVGIERMDKSPALFGTFQFSPNKDVLQNNTRHIDVNKEVNGGRNTPSRWNVLYA
jgi:hypothetical protein